MRKTLIITYTLASAFACAHAWSDCGTFTTSANCQTFNRQPDGSYYGQGGGSFYRQPDNTYTYHSPGYSPLSGGMPPSCSNETGSVNCR